MANILAPIVLTAALMTPANPVVVKDNHGGKVVEFFDQMQQWKEAGTKVEIHGKCESACTIYLMLPRDQLCIAKDATFGFHRVSGGIAAGVQFYNNYLMHTGWPKWAVKWILDEGGLDWYIKTMPHEYAAKFVRSCP